jgi:hypothetical protein
VHAAGPWLTNANSLILSPAPPIVVPARGLSSRTVQRAPGPGRRPPRVRRRRPELGCLLARDAAPDDQVPSRPGDLACFPGVERRWPRCDRGSSCRCVGCGSLANPFRRQLRGGRRSRRFVGRPFTVPRPVIASSAFSRRHDPVAGLSAAAAASRACHRCGRRRSATPCASTPMRTARERQAAPWTGAAKCRRAGHRPRPLRDRLASSPRIPPSAYPSTPPQGRRRQRQRTASWRSCASSRSTDRTQRRLIAARPGSRHPRRSSPGPSTPCSHQDVPGSARSEPDAKTHARPASPPAALTEERPPTCTSIQRAHAAQAAATECSLPCSFSSWRSGRDQCASPRTDANRYIADRSIGKSPPCGAAAYSMTWYRGISSQAAASALCGSVNGTRWYRSE